jgi:type I restriction enzyme M protein
MNLAVRGIDADIRWNNEGSFHKDELKDLRFDYILANPPFNISDWGGERLREDSRLTYGVPPVGNANYGWLQHICWHLAPNATAGVVLANGSMSSAQSGEDTIRKASVEADVVDCMVALPGQLFYSTQIPACLWFLARNKNPGGKMRDRRGEVLFINARKLGTLLDRTRREFSDHPLDGRDLLPVLTGQAPLCERTLYWRMANRSQRAVRRGDWKYLKVSDKEYLFHIG